MTGKGVGQVNTDKPATARNERKMALVGCDRNIKFCIAVLKAFLMVTRFYKGVTLNRSQVPLNDEGTEITTPCVENTRTNADESEGVML